MGMKALNAGHKAKEVRSIRYDTAAKVAEIAKREKVNFVLISGDLFEHHDIDDAVVRKTVQVLEAFAPIPVYVLPGNHDPAVPGGVWDRQSWKRVGDHVKLLREQGEIVIVGGVVLYSSPLFQKQSAIDPTEWIPPREPTDDRIRIGIAHGALDILPEKTNFPIAVDRDTHAGLDYLALGDWHGFLHNGKTVYPGTFEQTSFSEKDPGNIVIVEIAEASCEPVISKRHVGKLTWTEYRPTIHDATDVEQLRSSIIGNGSIETKIVRVLPEIPPDISNQAISELISLREELLEDAMFLDWDEELLRSSSFSEVTIPDGLLAQVDSDLKDISEGKIPDGPGREFASVDLSISEEAKSLLKRLAMEGSQ
jgi:DNA repair exonuclease SbcCD nuclease subunit